MGKYKKNSTYQFNKFFIVYGLGYNTFLKNGEIEF